MPENGAELRPVGSPPSGKERSAGERPLSSRLTRCLAVAVVLVVATYTWVWHRQHRLLQRERVVHGAALVSRSLVPVTEALLRQGRVAELDDLLRAALQAEEVFAAATIGPAGSVSAGSAVDVPCLRAALGPALPPAQPVSGWAGCGGGVHWLATPLRARPGWLVVGLRYRSGTAPAQRQLLLTLTLVMAAGVMAALALRRFLGRPLDEIGVALRTLDTPGNAAPLRAARTTTGGPGRLAARVKDVAAELRGRRARGQREAEERGALERQLAQAERFAMIGRLSGGLAHELGSPLSVIGLHAGSIQQATAPGQPVHEQARTITQEVMRASAFLEGLLHLSGRQRVVLRPVELRELVASVAAELTEEARARAVGIEVSMPAEPIEVKGDPVLLTHALRNVLRNAVQAVRDREPPRWVGVALRLEGGDVLVTVDDNGPGIPAERLAHLFEPFHTTKAPGEGIGLGLTVSKGIVVEHSGDLQVENRAGGGVRVTLRLPCTRDSEEPA